MRKWLLSADLFEFAHPLTSRLQNSAQKQGREYRHRVLAPPIRGAGSVVNADGCSLAQLCPCEGPWRDHDEYVSCASQRSLEFYREGVITSGQRKETISTAAQSDCGKERRPKAGNPPGDRHVRGHTPTPFSDPGVRTDAAAQL